MTNGAATVVVVGGGLAGLVAAIRAKQTASGVRVVLLDKEPKIGGNSSKASSGMSAVDDKVQKARGIADSVELFQEDLVRSAGRLADDGLLHVLSEMSESTVHWLEEALGVELSDVILTGGHAVPRTLRFPPKDGVLPPIGFTLTSSAQKAAAKLGVEIINGAKVTKITQSPSVDMIHPGHVTGVVYTNVADGTSHDLAASAVVLATGGFSNDHSESSLLKRYVPELAGFPSTNGAFATGDGMKLAEACGAELVHMDQVQIHPTALVDPADANNMWKFLAPEGLRGVGGLLISHEGKRFVNELEQRDVVTKAIRERCVASGANVGGIAYLVLSEAAKAAYGSSAIGFYESKGVFHKVTGVAGVASEIAKSSSVPLDHIAANLREQLTTCAALAQSKAADAFGKTAHANLVAAAELDSAPFFVAAVTPAIHYTQGGVAVSASGEALYMSRFGNLKPLPRLFVCGECSGGLHGCNRLAGASLLDCAVFGRIAGQRAAEAAQLSETDSPLSPSQFTALRLAQKVRIGSSAYKFVFDLPSPLQTTGLGVGQYVNVRAALTPGTEPIVRSYSPMSRPNDFGRLELLVKIDAASGNMSKYLGALRVGDSLEFSGPIGGIDLYGKRIKKIGMIAGGVGISPMISIIRSSLANNTGHQMKLIYGAVFADELMFRDLLEREAQEHPGTFDISMTLDKPPIGWAHHTGFVDAALIRSCMFPPSDDLKIIICGPPGMCKALKNLLPTLGYTPDMFYSYM